MAITAVLLANNGGFVILIKSCIYANFDSGLKLLIQSLRQLIVGSLLSVRYAMMRGSRSYNNRPGGAVGSGV